MEVDMDDALEKLSGFETMSRIKEAKVAAVVLAEARPAGAGPAVGALPALAAMQAGRGQVVAVLGEGLWRWSLLQREQRDVEGVYDAFWSNLVRWLALGGDLQPGQDVSLKLSRSSAWLGDQVMVDVVFRLTPQAGAHLAATIRDPGGQVSEMPMQRLPGREARYRAVVEARTTGTYRVALHTPGLDPERQERAFSVHDVNLERLQSAAAPGALRHLAEETGGVAFKAFEAERLTEVLAHERLARMVPSEPECIWDRGFVLFSILAWAGLEWLVRRRGGLL
jgi:hypothetical protein